MSDLFKIKEEVRPAKNKKQVHRARVIGNKDPLKIGRIKVTSQSLLEETDVEKTIWIYPTVSTGASPANKIFNVPEIGTEVEIFTKGETEESWFYRGTSDNQLTATPDVFDPHYPKTIGAVNSSGDLFRIDKETGELEFYRKMFSTLFRQDEEGHMYLTLPNNLTIKAKNINFETQESFAIKANNNFGLKCTQFEAEAEGDSSISTTGTLGINGGEIVTTATTSLKAGSPAMVLHGSITLDMGGGTTNIKSSTLSKVNGPLVILGSTLVVGGTPETPTPISESKAGILPGLLSTLSSYISKIKSAFSLVDSMMTKVLCKDSSNRRRIGKE